MAVIQYCVKLIANTVCLVSRLATDQIRSNLLKPSMDQNCSTVIITHSLLSIIAHASLFAGNVSLVVLHTPPPPRGPFEEKKKRGEKFKFQSEL